MGVAKCVVPENIHTPPEGTFALDPLSPWNFHWVPSGKDICVKNVVAL